MGSCPEAVRDGHGGDTTTPPKSACMYLAGHSRVGFPIMWPRLSRMQDGIERTNPHKKKSKKKKK
jgi:hypothetical protein